MTLRFPVRGDRVPLLHGYNLYSAIIAANPHLKEIDWQLKPITGNYRRHWIELSRDSHFAIRCHLSVLEELTMPQLLRVERSYVEVGEMEGESIRPSATLYSPIVVIKQALEVGQKYSRDKFLISLGKQLAKLGIEGVPTVGTQKRYVKIRSNSVIGFEVSFTGLGDLSSSLLQQYGLGGKRRMGCGGFWPHE